MVKKVKTELFWFVKKDAEFDLDDPAVRETYVQQVITHGRYEDIRELLRDLGISGVYSAFEKCKHFVPKPVRLFWEAFFANHSSSEQPRITIGNNFKL